MSFKALFIDTNILLHYRAFDEIDWLGILNAEQINIYLPSIVIQELDKHKYSSSSKLRDKANKVIKKLHKLADFGLEVNLKLNININFEMSIKSPDFVRFNLDPSSQDDILLANILSFKSENLGLAVVLVTADLGLRLKAKFYQIESICLPDELKFPFELDQTDKRIKELEQEVLELQSRMPNLELCFSDNSNRLNYEAKKFLPSNLEVSKVIRERIEKLKQKYPKILSDRSIGQSVNNSVPISQMYGSDTSEILPFEISDYNRQLDEFYTEYKQYLGKYIPWLDIRCRVFFLKILISNFGTCPAKDIDVLMHFPDGFALCKLSELPNEPEKPHSPPQPVPRTRKERISIITNFLTAPTIPRLSPSSIVSQNQIQPNVSSLDIRRSNSYDVKLHVRKLKQNTIEAFEPIIVMFDSFEQISSFRIDYQLIAANVPKSVTGKLHVIFSHEPEC